MDSFRPRQLHSRTFFLRFTVVLWSLAVSAVVIAFRSAPPEEQSWQDPVRVQDSTLRPTKKPLSQQPDTTGRKIPTLIDSLGQPIPLSFQKDSLKQADSLHTNDTTKIEPVDSSARVEQFQHKRHDPVYAVSVSPWISSFYLKAPGAYKRDVVLDSTGRVVTIRETMLDEDVKVPITMPLDDYIQARLKAEQERMWHMQANEYHPVVREGGLGEVLGTFTNIDIPVPANPLLSIFGPPKINLKISGAVDIRAAFRTQKSDQTQISSLDQTRNEPNFNQEVQINVNGTIGDKLNILADWNTQRVFEYENQLKIKYTGYDDEIVQSIEAGNVSLSTPSTFVGSSQALFGIKARFQTGPLMLTTLLSQKKGQTRELTVTGGASAQNVRLYAWQYSKNHYFLDTTYRRFYNDLKASITPTYSFDMQFNHVKDIEVWVSQPPGRQPDQSARQAVAFIDLPRLAGGQRYDSTYRNQQSGPPGRFESWSFVRLGPAEYVLHEYEGYITINTSLLDQQAVAVAYRVEGPTAAPGDDIFFGEFSGTDTSRSTRLVLKLVKPTNLLPAYKPAWDLMLKNIYGLGGRDVRKDNFAVKIVREQATGDPTENILNQDRKLLNILGLDRLNQDNAPAVDSKGTVVGDNYFDFIPGFTIDPARAEIIFPTLEPFRTGIRQYFQTLTSLPPDTDNYVFGEVYDTTSYAAQSNSTKNKYVIDVTYQAAQTSRYNLGFNLVEGSVQVLLDGRSLVPNVDYTVDYILGEVVVRNQAALLPNANLQIKYEQNDLFQLASKTLMGARGEISPFQNTQLGFTVMNLNQQTLSDKVRLGEEPTNNTIFGVDGSTSFSLPVVTSGLNALPLYQTREPSSWRVSGEAAYMVPDPNTKKSTIPSDGGQSIAYIDDFEGARRTIPLGLSYSSWTPSSAPVLGYASGRELLMSTDSRAKLNWYNNSRDNLPVTVHEIWPNRSTRAGEDFVNVLTLDFYPQRRGMFNYSGNIDSTLLLNPGNNWNGVLKYLSTTGSNLLDQNIGFLEIWMRADGANPNDMRRGKLHVDLGVVSEAVIGDPADTLIRRMKGLRREDPLSEDLVVNKIPNGILNPGEDVGLDMLTDAEEHTLFPDLGSDPSGDDYGYTTASADFDRINGSEGNQFSIGGQFPNTEDINGNFQLDIVNNYLEYEVPLDTVYLDSLGFQRSNQYVVGGGQNGWYQFRIPILNPTRIRTQGTQTPQDILQNLQFVRMFLKGFSENVRVRIADINLVGNQWQEFTQNDSVMKVSVVNIEDNPEYDSPDYRALGIIRERDRTQPDQVVLANEQSLSLILNNLPADSIRQAVKNYTIRPLDVFNYKEMKMFVHGDPKFVFIDASNYDAAIFLRFGSDTANFYEYREPIRSGWADNEVDINFSELTAIKTLRQVRGDSINVLSRPVPVANRPGAEYRVRGNPTLTNIRSIWVGVINMMGRRRPPPLEVPRGLSGQVWINELRLIGVDDQPGVAYRFDTQLKLADLGDVSFNYSRIDPQFHSLDQRFGNRITNINWGLSVNVGLDKFFPQTWQGTSIPFNYSHSENLSTPKYLPNTDVQVEEAANRAPPAEAENTRVAAQTLRVTETYAAPNVRLGLPSQAWYVRDTFNKMSMGFTYSTSRERNPVTEQRTSWQWTGSFTYGVSLPTDYYFQPFITVFDGVFLLSGLKAMKIYYAPVSFSTGLNLTRSQTRESLRGVSGDRPVTRNFTASRSVGFSYKLTEGGLLNLGGDYNLSIESNLTHLETDPFGNQRPFSKIIGELFFKDRFVSFGRDARYGQRFSTNSRPKIPPLFDLDKYMDLTLGYSVNYNWQNNFQRGDLDKSAGWDNSISATTNVRLKALTEGLVSLGDEGTTAPREPSVDPRRRHKTEVEAQQDTTAVDSAKAHEPRQEEEQPPQTPSANLKRLYKYLIKVPFLEYETINISFTQTNRVGNGGVVGDPGFRNFWTRIPFFQQQVLEYGPTRLYQLGIVSDPSGRLVVQSQPRFPFVGFTVYPGPRAANAQLVDQFGQTNRLSTKTSRALWEGANLDLSWSVGWTFNKNTTIRTDSLGIPTAGSVTTSGSVERSFLSIPPVFFLKVFKSGIEDVGRKYNAIRRDSTRPDDIKLAESFEQGFESLPLLKKVFGPYFPRFNYTFRWDGLEKLPGFSEYVERLSIDHAYQSTFTRQWRGDPDGGERTDAERVSYGFAPLLGIDATMKELLKGNIKANIRYNSSTAYDLNISARNIVETYSQEVAFTFSYARRGFEFLFFGISLSNDLEVGATYSLTKNSRRTYDVNTLESNPTGTPLEGSTRTVLEPRIRYVLSSRVTASIFYRYTKVAPDEGGSTIPGTTTNEAGLDVHIAIQ